MSGYYAVLMVVRASDEEDAHETARGGSDHPYADEITFVGDPWAVVPTVDDDGFETVGCIAQLPKPGGLPGDGLAGEADCICTDADNPNDHRPDCPCWGVPEATATDADGVPLFSAETQAEAEALTPEAAFQAIHDGRTVKLTVGTGADDPVLLVRRDGDTVMSTAIGGWSEGVTEPVCFIGSDYLPTFLGDRAALELVAER